MKESSHRWFHFSLAPCTCPCPFPFPFPLPLRHCQRVSFAFGREETKPSPSRLGSVSISVAAFARHHLFSMSSLRRELCLSARPFVFFSLSLHIIVCCVCLPSKLWVWELGMWIQLMPCTSVTMAKAYYLLPWAQAHSDVYGSPQMCRYGYADTRPRPDLHSLGSLGRISQIATSSVEKMPGRGGCCCCCGWFSSFSSDMANKWEEITIGNLNIDCSHVECRWQSNGDKLHLNRPMSNRKISSGHSLSQSKL